MTAQMMKTIIFLSFFLIQTAPIFASSADELHVEGISYEAQNEAASIAVVNGQFLKEGDTTGRYKVVKIGSNVVRVRDEQNGAESELNITGSAPKTEMPQEAPAAPAAPVENPPPAKPAGSNPLAMFNPAGMINMANETAIFAAIKQIHMTAMAYHAQEGEMESITIQKLVERDMISDIYANEYKGYRFSVTSQYDNIQVFADPAADGPDRKHYLADRHGVVRVEMGKQATDKSPPKNA